MHHPHQVPRQGYGGTFLGTGPDEGQTRDPKDLDVGGAEACPFESHEDIDALA
jgi:hypothetical protein